MTSSWFFLSKLNYDAGSTTHQILKKLSDYVRDDYSIDDGGECDENYVQRTENDWERAGDASSDDHCCCFEVDTTEVCFQG